MGMEASWITKIVTYGKIDLVATILFLSQGLFVIGYFVNENILAYTSLLGNDHNHQASASFSIWFIAMHSVFNTIVVYRIARNIKFGSYFTSGGPSGKAFMDSNAPTSISDTKVSKISEIKD